MSERRKIFGEKFVDLGNYTVVGLIFSQIIGIEKNLVIIVIGIFLLVFFWIIGYILLKQEGRKR